MRYLEESPFSNYLLQYFGFGGKGTRLQNEKSRKGAQNI